MVSKIDGKVDELADSAKNLSGFLGEIVTKMKNGLLGSTDDTIEEAAEKEIKEASGELDTALKKGEDAVEDTHDAGKAAEEIKKVYTGGRTQEELEDLARDPSHAGRIEPQGIKEREIGLDLEKRGDLGRIIRDPQINKGAEFIDTTTGLKWDVKSFESYPVGANGIPITNARNGAFRVDKGMAKIYKEFDKGNNVIVDIRKMIPEHIEQLKKAIDEAGISDRIIWYP